jgi:hypothetical protein
MREPLQFRPISKIPSITAIYTHAYASGAYRSSCFICFIGEYRLCGETYNNIKALILAESVEKLKGWKVTQKYLAECTMM